MEIKHIQLIPKWIFGDNTFDPDCTNLKADYVIFSMRNIQLLEVTTKLSAYIRN